MDEFLSVQDTIDVTDNARLTKEYQLIPACTLSISSAPEQSSIYINSVYYGQTPSVVHGLRAGIVIATISHNLFFTEVDTITVSPAAMNVLACRLKVRPGRLSVQVPDTTVQVSLNGEIVSHGSLEDTVVTPGKIEVSVKEPPLGLSASQSVYVVPNSSVHVHCAYSAVSPLEKSLVLPGYGQILAGHETLGFTFAIAFFGGLAVGAGAHLVGNSYSRDYSDTYQIYNSTNYTPRVMALHNTAQQQYDNMRAAYRVRNIGIMTAFAVYVISAAEACFLQDQTVLIISTDGNASLVPSNTPKPRLAVIQIKFVL